MNKKNWIIAILIVFLLVVGGLYFYFSNNSNDKVSKNNKENSYEANKTASNSSNDTNKENINNDTSKNSSNDTDINTANNTAINSNSSNEEKPQPPKAVEEQIATFSTKIYTKDEARQNNISITCKSLNNTIVKNGETFSFCGKIGPATTAKGYQKADIFDRNGNKKKGLGGRKLPNKYYSLQCCIGCPNTSSNRKTCSQ